ncbi:PEP-CTERM sorting domain-containing protein [Phycisphaerales bacterium AB-hyl4]|uniref:PEP-CTERM sorting domain-containing protein n=1 Tax=Natronomicrosphaera hydrolytica TaxID=3242702 RepID=A0ABV4U8R5_9BACT
MLNSRLTMGVAAMAMTASLALPAQASFIATDNFEDGDFTSNPTWVAHTDGFSVATTGWGSRSYLRVEPSTAYNSTISLDLKQFDLLDLSQSFAISFETRTAASNHDGHVVQFSLFDAATETGYTVTATEMSTMFGSSGFARGNYRAIAATLGSQNLPTNATSVLITLEYNPSNDEVIVTRNDSLVGSFIGSQGLGELDTFEIRLGNTGGAPVRYFDNFQIEGTMIPEPGSLALLSLGALALMRRRH